MRRETLDSIKLHAIGVGIGVAVFSSFFLFGLRAKAATIRDGVNTPIYTELITMDRAEMEDLRNAEPVLVVEDVSETASVGYSESDLDLLAALVWAEAGDQDEIGQWIVADCVCNRASDRHPEWPSSISEVIYQPGQFSVVANGRLAQGFQNATPLNYEVAQRALSGEHYDTNVIYFSMYYCANGQFAYVHQDHYIGY